MKWCGQHPTLKRLPGEDPGSVRIRRNDLKPCGAHVVRAFALPEVRHQDLAPATTLRVNQERSLTFSGCVIRNPAKRRAFRHNRCGAVAAVRGFVSFTTCGTGSCRNCRTAFLRGNLAAFAAKRKFDSSSQILVLARISSCVNLQSVRHGTRIASGRTAAGSWMNHTCCNAATLPMWQNRREVDQVGILGATRNAGIHRPTPLLGRVGLANRWCRERRLCTLAQALPHSNLLPQPVCRLPGFRRTGDDGGH